MYKNGYMHKSSKIKGGERKALDKEMTRRFNELETGKVKGYTLDELEEHARSAYKTKKVKQ